MKKVVEYSFVWINLFWNIQLSDDIVAASLSRKAMGNQIRPTSPNIRRKGCKCLFLLWTFFMNSNNCTKRMRKCTWADSFVSSQDKRHPYWESTFLVQYKRKKHILDHVQSLLPDVKRNFCPIFSVLVKDLFVQWWLFKCLLPIKNWLVELKLEKTYYIYKLYN